MASYWSTFRPASDASYQQRYDKLLQAMVKIRGDGSSWAEPTSYWAFDSALGLDAAATVLSAPLASQDLIVVGVLGMSGVVYFGKVEHPDAFKAMFPLARKLG